MAQTPGTAEALLRMSGMYGSAWRADATNTYQMLAEVVQVVAEVSVNRVTVPIVGSTRDGHKPGRETREGTLSIQKIDAKWEHEIWSYMSQGIEARRKLRDDPNQSRPSRTFDIHLKLDDPDALGLEEWVLHDCQLWSLPLGIDIGTDIIERQFPLTWESEEPLYAFQATRSGTGAASVVQPQWLTSSAYASSGIAPNRDF